MENEQHDAGHELITWAPEIWKAKYNLSTVCLDREDSVETFCARHFLKPDGTVFQKKQSISG